MGVTFDFGLHLSDLLPPLLLFLAESGLPLVLFLLEGLFLLLEHLQSLQTSIRPRTTQACCRTLRWPSLAGCWHCRWGRPAAAAVAWTCRGWRLSGCEPLCT